MPRVRGLLRALTVNEIELPNLIAPQSEAEAPETPCSPSTIGPFGQREAFIYQPKGHPKQALIDGEIWPPIFKAEFVRSAKRITPLDTDVFVCTYPKCGTTWIQHICSQLMTADYGPEVGKELCVTSPMIERMGAKFTENIKHPRLLKTHFNWSNCPKSPTAKYIFAVRNPKDCLTSYFFHNRNFKIYEWAEGDFDIFFELFCAGKLGFGDYFEHLLSWLPRMDDDNVLFLKYEDMCADLETTVYKIGNFLGGRAAQLVANPETLRRVVADSGIDSMKQNQGRWFPGSVLRSQTFIRKGGSRDWKNHMSREQSDRLDRIFQKRLAGTVAADWWKEDMSWSDEETSKMLTADTVLSDALFARQLRLRATNLIELQSEEAEREEEEEDEGFPTRRNTFSIASARSATLSPCYPAHMGRGGSMESVVNNPQQQSDSITIEGGSTPSSGYVSAANSSVCSSRSSLLLG